MAREVVFAPEARDDLIELYRFIAERDGEARALGYIERIEAYCLGFADSRIVARGAMTCCPAMGWNRARFFKGH